MKRFTIFAAILVPLLLITSLFSYNQEAVGTDGSPRIQIDTEADPFDIQIVRAYYDDEAIVGQISRWTELWEWNKEEGYVVLNATPSELLWLGNLGMRIEVDEALTTLYSTPNELLPNQGGGIPGFACYRTVEETFATAENIVAAHPTLASWIDIGDSWEKIQNASNGYDLQVLKLTNSAIPGPKPVFFAMTAVHAREYTTAELNTRFAEYLIANYGVNADITWLLDYHEIHLLLQANPDGRKQAETGILWRKNTNENFCSPTSNFRGVDLNRNFPFRWGCCNGSETNECAETFRGPGAASEPEVEAIVNYTASIYDDVRPPDITVAAPITTSGVFLDIHSFGEDVIWPWGSTFDAAPNSTELTTLGRKLADFNGYTAAQATIFGITDGTTDDFAYGEYGVAAYTYELGTTFFQSCSAFENTIYPDNLPSLVYAAKVARAPYMLPAGPDAVDLSHETLTVPFGATAVFSATIDDTRFNGPEPTQTITQAEFFIDVPPWITTTMPLPIPMTAADGAFDASVEIVSGSVDSSTLSLGRHTIFIRGQDAAGNWGVVSALFINVVNSQELYLPVIATP